MVTPFFPIIIGNVGDGNVQFGPILNQSPISVSKNTSGAGGGNSGPFVITNTFWSSNITLSKELI